jgi:flagellin
MSRINTNPSANFAYRNLTNTSKQLSRSIGRLSSGFRLNSSGDAPADMAIANRLRAEARSLAQAGRNVSQASSVLAIADGGLQTIAGVLDRLKELASQSASDNVSDGDRVKLEAEFQTLKSEITRITETTKYQGIGLLDGGFGNSVDTNAAVSTALAAGTGLYEVKSNGSAAGTYSITDAAGDVTLSFDPDGAGPLGAITQTVSGVIAGRQSLTFDRFGFTLELGADYVVGAMDTTDIVVTSSGSGSFLVTSSGAYTTSDLVSVSSIDLRLSALGLADLADTIATAAEARITLTDIDTAIEAVTDAVGTLGAAINRLDIAATNVATLYENVIAAESVIRDVDIAQETTNLTRLQILQQSGIALLAQANAAPQALLQLLQG